MENIACHFVFYTGPRKGDAETFDTARITIGRSGNCDFRLEADPVAAQHAEILLEEGNVYRLYDLGSRQGTFVNGERVHERCTLQSEDYIRFGQEGPEIIFRVGRPRAGKQPLPQVFPVTAELEFFSGSDAGRIFPINAAVVTNIGRRAELEIPLDPRGDMIVSGNHCNIRYLDGHFVMSDTSRNGTYVNGDLVEQPMEILDGDVIMLGDGGPQARFRVDPVKRHYPNHRVLSPVSKPEPESRSALPPRANPAPGPLLASAAPYASGNARPEPEQPAPEQASEIVGEEAPLEDTATTAPGDSADLVDSMDSSKEDEQPKLVDDTEAAVSSHEEVEETPVEDTAEKKHPVPSAAVPLRHKIGFKPGKKLIIAAIAAVVVIALIALLLPDDEAQAPGGASRGDYAAALQNLETVESDAGFSVKIPEGWTKLSQDSKISAESADKKIALDYVRDPALNETKVRQMLASNGAAVNPEAEEKISDGMKVKMLDASIGGIRRVAVLHQPASGAPALAMLETTNETLEELEEDTINQLLVDNITIAAVPAETAASPATPAATPEAALPTPAAATPAPQSPAPNAETPAESTPVSTPPAPAESPVVAATASPTPAATAEASPTPLTENKKTVQSEALDLTLSIPENWSGVSEEADAMVTLSDGQGLEIRIARDPGDLDPKGTFDAMEGEGWTIDGTKTDDNFQAAEFSKEGQNLMLALIPEKAKTTLVVYATSNKDFTAEQRRQISLVIYQLAPAE